MGTDCDFNYDDADAIYYEGLYGPATYVGIVDDYFPAPCEMPGCSAIANRWGVCETHSKGKPAGDTATSHPRVFKRGVKFAARADNKRVMRYRQGFDTFEDAAAWADSPQ